MHENIVIQPTSGQIAKLNALLRESELLARQINFPIVSASVSMATTLLLSELGILNASKEIFTENRNSLINFLESALVISLFYYLSYTFYQKISLLALSTFPQGVGYSRIPHHVYMMQKKLGTRDEVANLIKDLKKITLSQKSSKIKSIYYIIFFNIIVAMAGIISSGRYRFSLTSSVYGPSIGFSPVDDNIPLKILSRTARYQQGLTFLNFFYKKWDNYNITEQIKFFFKKIKNISCISDNSAKWQIVDNDIDMKESAVFLLQAPEKNIKFCAQNDRQPHEISKENYFIEMHRIFLEEEIPVYLSSENEMYVGFYALDEKRCQRIQKIFFNRLLKTEQHEKIKGEILKILNNNLPTFMINKNLWEFYIASDEKGQFETIFYLRRNIVHTGIFNCYFNALKKALPQNKVTFDGEIISIRVVKREEFNYFTSQFKLDIEWTIYSEAFSHTKTTSVVSRRGKNKGNSSSDDIVEMKDDIKVQKKSPYPDRINFGGGVCFFKNASTPKPDNFAYPMRVPWLSEGKAYVSVDPAAIEAVSTYLTKEEVLNPFDKGNVVGPDERKTNVIQSTNEPYQDVHGQNHLTSGYKGKWSKNIRMFCFHASTVTINNQEYLHYRCNGPSFGH